MGHDCDDHSMSDMPPLSVQERIAGQLIASIGFVAVCFLHITHMRRLKEGTHCSAQRGLYKIVCRLAPVYAAVHALGVTLPRLMEVTTLLSHIYVSVAMYAFLELMLLAVHGLSAGGGGGSRLGHEVGLSFLLDPKEHIQHIVKVLEAQEPLRIWTAPPLGCIFRLCPCTPCGAKSVPSADVVKFARTSLGLYIATNPLLPFLKLAARAEMSHADQGYANTALALATFGLALVALYGLFIVYRVTHVPLHNMRTTLKFVAIKASIPSHRIA
jgi:hypothetical protein